jgi:hypothetical protein
MLLEQLADRFAHQVNIAPCRPAGPAPGFNAKAPGRPRYHVPTFQMIAEINSENTMAKPAHEPTFSTSSTGSSAITPKATRPLDARTPIKFHTIDYGDYTLINFIGMKKS